MGLLFPSLSDDIDRMDISSKIKLIADELNRRDTVLAVTTATLALAAATHAHRTLRAERAAGIAFTLPAATGSGDKYRVVVGTTFTGNCTVAVTGNDTFKGVALAAADGGNSLNAWEAAAGDNRITLDGTTTGGYAGDVIELEDVKADVWSARLVLAQTGTEATPFSTV